MAKIRWATQLLFTKQHYSLIDTVQVVTDILDIFLNYTSLMNYRTTYGFKHVCKTRHFGKDSSLCLSVCTAQRFTVADHPRLTGRGTAPKAESSCPLQHL